MACTARNCWKRPTAFTVCGPCRVSVVKSRIRVRRWAGLSTPATSVCCAESSRPSGTPVSALTSASRAGATVRQGAKCFASAVTVPISACVQSVPTSSCVKRVNSATGAVASVPA